MTASAFDSRIYGPLFGDDAVAARFDDREVVRAMLKVEGALARAEAECGLIPTEAAVSITAAAESLDPDPAQLAEGTAASGVPVPALVEILREAVGDEAASYVHWGATSQDIVDTALILRLREVMDVIDGRLQELARQLLDLARRHRGTPMLARTRTQAAVPTSFGLKVAAWAAPLLRHRQRLDEIRPRLLVAQLGGAGGTRSVLGKAGDNVVAAFARELELGDVPIPWHSQRDAIAELAGWLSLVTGSVAKMAQDILLLAQNEVAEVRVAGGGSSAMPQKANPVAAEVLVTLARHNAVLLAEMHQSLVHAHERDGAAWSGEWLALPEMAVAAGASLSGAGTLIATLTVNTARMMDNLAALNGLALAEAAAYALSRHMPRQDAVRVVKAATERASAGGRHLLDVLAESTDAPVDWTALKDPAGQIETARTILDGFLSRERTRD
ncbi:MAG: 3-carboxy-cis,cis-muconate cycloisomerase [Arenicellales bacterium]